MGFIHGKNTVVLFKDANLSAFFNDSSTSRSMETADTTTYGVAGGSKTYIVGLNDGTISLGGLFDGDAGAVDEKLTATLGAAGTHPTLVASGGVAIGKRCIIADVEQTSHEISSPVADVVSLSAELQSSAGIDSGVVLHALAPESTDTDSASVDHGAATTGGGIAHLHAIANTRNGAVTVKVQHSADDITFADLATFTALSSTTTGAQRVVVAAGTTVNRYLRAKSTFAGSTGSTTYTVAFARR